MSIVNGYSVEAGDMSAGLSRPATELDQIELPLAKRQKLAVGEAGIDYNHIEEHGNTLPAQSDKPSNALLGLDHLSNQDTKSSISAHGTSVDDTIIDELLVQTPRPNESTGNGRRSSRIAAKPTQPAANTEYTAATSEEKQQWRGFCEIESEPIILNALLHDLSGDHVELKEVYAMDEDIIKHLGRIIHGFIFLYQVLDEDDEIEDPFIADTDSATTEYPWFANQTASNSCATVALTNMLANRQATPHPWASSTDSLGNRLIADTTQASAFERGEAIRKRCGEVHNKYARKMEMLDADLVLDNRWEDGNKKPRGCTKKKGGKFKKTPLRKKKPKSSENVHHYVAYVWDSTSSVWMLDGLRSQPVKVAEYTSTEETPAQTWWHAVLPVIQQRMADFADGGISANLLALVESPITETIANLGLRGANIVKLEKVLDAIDMNESVAKYDRYHPSAPTFADSTYDRKPSLQGIKLTMQSREDDYVPSVRVTGVNEDLGVTKRCWDWAVDLMERQRKLGTDGSFESVEQEASHRKSQWSTLVAVRLRCLLEQAQFKAEIVSAMERRRAELEQAEAKQIDSGPFLHAWLGMLADCQEWKDSIIARGGFT